MKVNQTTVTEVGQALVEIARVAVPAGVERISFSINVENVAAFDQCQLRGSIGGVEFTFASAGANFTGAVFPIERASGDLTALAANSNGYLIVDSKGLSELAIYAACAADGPTTVTVTAQG